MANKVTTSAANGNSDERTDVFYGAENVLKTELQIFSNATEKIDSCMNFTRPQLAVELELIKKAFMDGKGRGLRIRYLTEITPENVSFCKELMSGAAAPGRNKREFYDKPIRILCTFDFIQKSGDSTTNYLQ